MQKFIFDHEGKIIVTVAFSNAISWYIDKHQIYKMSNQISHWKASSMREAVADEKILLACKQKQTFEVNMKDITIMR